MNERELFKKTFDAVPAPKYLAARAAANADTRTARRAPSRLLRTAVIAAVIVATLSVAAAAGFLGLGTTKTDYLDLCNQELDVLREMGLFHIEFEIEETSLQPHYDDIGPDMIYVGQVGSHGGGEIVYYSVTGNMDTNKISGLSITARPQEDTEPAYFDELGPWYIYDNFDAIFDTDMTVGEYCEIWRQYQGYERYELPEGVEPGIRLLDTRELDAWVFSYEGNGIRIPFYRAGETEPEYVWISYEATGQGPAMCFGDASIKG